MGALIQSKASHFAPFKANRSLNESMRRQNLLTPARAVLAHEPHAFPETSTSPALPMTIRDEMLEFYAFVFCQGGFRQAGMTFEQFLLVAAAIKPTDLPAAR